MHTFNFVQSQHIVFIRATLRIPQLITSFSSSSFPQATLLVAVAVVTVTVAVVMAVAVVTVTVAVVMAAVVAMVTVAVMVVAAAAATAVVVVATVVAVVATAAAVAAVVVTAAVVAGTVAIPMIKILSQRVKPTKKRPTTCSAERTLASISKHMKISPWKCLAVMPLTPSLLSRMLIWDLRCYLTCVDASTTSPHRCNATPFPLALLVVT